MSQAYEVPPGHKEGRLPALGIQLLGLKKHKAIYLKRKDHRFPVTAVGNDSNLATWNKFIFSLVWGTKVWSKVGSRSLWSSGSLPLLTAAPCIPWLVRAQLSLPVPSHCLCLCEPICWPSPLRTLSTEFKPTRSPGHSPLKILNRRVRTSPLIGLQHPGMLWLVYLLSRPLKLLCYQQ